MGQVYTFANSGHEAKRIMEKKISQISNNKRLSCGRCIDCGLLFTTLKLYKRRTCKLCKYEKNEKYKTAVQKSIKEKAGYFIEKEFYDQQIKRHLQLQIRKDRINEALKVKVIKAPECRRLKDLKF